MTLEEKKQKIENLAKELGVVIYSQINVLKHPQYYAIRPEIIQMVLDCVKDQVMFKEVEVKAATEPPI